ncbi:MAG: hypothetical protein GC136_06090 [Alphaproteobacteria bacterium]|nr:hypothetical protein [Alphaproteobacteria bacterium]
MNLMDELGITQGMLDAFSAKGGSDKAGLDMTHPDGDSILNEAIEILEKIPEGLRLLEVKNTYNIPIKVIKGKEITFNLPDEDTVYIFAPSGKKNPAEILALAVACGLREAEHKIVGFTRPSKHLPMEEQAQIIYSKSLDIILCMCRIADEIHEKFKLRTVLDIIDELGHGEVYKAFKENKDLTGVGSVFLKD